MVAPVTTMPIHIGIMCERCGRVYFVTTSGRIRPEKRKGTVYQLTCAPPCGAIRYFKKNEMQPYIASDYAANRGYGERTECELVREP